MEQVKKYKNILIGVGVLIVVFGGYYYWQSGSGSATTNSLIASPSSPDALSPNQSFAGQEILSVLNQLRGIKIDTSVFDSPAFKSLVDHTIATTTEPIGRPDPFAPYDATTTGLGQ